MVDREVLGLNPSTDASFHGYTMKEFHKIRCPAIAQHSQEITLSKGSAIHMALNFAQRFLISGLLISCELVTPLYDILPRG